MFTTDKQTTCNIFLEKSIRKTPEQRKSNLFSCKSKAKSINQKSFAKNISKKNTLEN